MTVEEKTLTDPLGLLGLGDEFSQSPGAFGAVLARAGVGKTTLMIQIALNQMAGQRRVLHISLSEPIAKVDAHYREVFDSQAQQHQLEHPDVLWDAIVPNRFIMTFQVEGFSVPKLEERLTDLTTQNIFHPQMIIVDGLPFDEPIQQTLEALKLLAQKAKAPMWFAVTTHRHESPAADGLPVQLSPVQDLFGVAINLQPHEQVVKINLLKPAGDRDPGVGLILDPPTGLIRKEA